MSDAAGPNPPAAAGTATFAISGTQNRDWVAATVALRPFTDNLCANPTQQGTTTLGGGIINTYYPGAATASAGSTSITVGAANANGPRNPISRTDLLLVIQMQDADINSTNTPNYGANDGTGSGATSYNNAGKYEFVTALNSVGVGGGTLSIKGAGTGGGLLNTYTNADATTTKGQKRFQVVRVPQYFQVTVTGTLTAAPWNGASGGIFAMDVVDGTLEFSGGSINVNAKGFRGGGGQALQGAASGSGLSNTDYRSLASLAANGNKGEGVAGSPNFMYDGTGTLATGSGYPDGTSANASRARGAPGNAGGGATDGRPQGGTAGYNDENSGGGGGGNGGAGGLGGNTWNSNLPRGGFGGAAFPYAPDRLAMGGGGGSGSRNNSTGVQSSGGLGGGLIIVRANSITGTATLSANGGWPATDNYTPAQDGGGGGGAGGSVLVFASTTDGLTNLTITARGDKGANAWPTSGPGTNCPVNPGDAGSPNCNYHGPGGGGAGGVIYLSSNIAGSSTSVAGSANGKTTTATNDYGATQGTGGVTNTTLTESQIPGVIPGDSCKVTLASVAAFGATVESGRVVLSWETSFELGTAGFHVERLEPVSGDYERLNETLLPALITSPQGGRYSYIDPDAWPDQTYTYRLVEQEVWGSTRVHGPYTVTPTTPAARTQAATLQSAPADEADGAYADPAQGFHATPHPLVTRAVAYRTQATTMASNIPTTGLARIPVRKAGLIAVSTADIAKALGASETNVRQWIRSSSLELTVAGNKVAWMAAANAAGILFYGEAIDSLYTLDNIYRLRRATGAVMDEASGKGPAAVAAGDFADTLVAEQDLLTATVVSTCTECDYWYWAGFIGGNDPTWSTKEFTVSLPNPTAGGTLSVFLKGAASGDHSAQVSINGQSLGQGAWKDLTDYELRLPVTGAQLKNGDNTVVVTALGGSDNMFYLDRISASYRRLARAVDNQLTLRAERDGPLAVDGFGTTDLYVFDISSPRNPIRLNGTTVAPGAVGQSVTFNAEEGHRYLALASTAIATATPAPMTAADLGTTRNRMDYLVIAPPQSQYPDLWNEAQQLADYRHRHGRGLSSQVVGTDEIYDSYNWGIASPYAVRDFLRQVVGKWGVRYIVLAGIGSFDYRDLKGLGEPQVPTLMTSTPNGLFGCDNCLVDFEGDGAPNVAIGRIPAASATDLKTYRTKVEAYEKGKFSLRQAGVLLLADQQDPKAGNFAQDSDALATLLPFGMNPGRIYLDQYDINTARSLLFQDMNQGVGWVNYIGHGGMDRFSAAGLLTTDVDDMSALHSAGSLLPVVSAPTCLANRFERPGYASLGERLVLDADGGAIAVWSATGLSLNTPAVLIDWSLFAEVFQQWTPTLGDAVQQALQANRQRQDVPAYMLRIYSLLGDPALELRP